MYWMYILYQPYIPLQYWGEKYQLNAVPWLCLTPLCSWTSKNLFHYMLIFLARLFPRCNCFKSEQILCMVYCLVFHLLIMILLFCKQKAGAIEHVVCFKHFIQSTYWFRFANKNFTNSCANRRDNTPLWLHMKIREISAYTISCLPITLFSSHCSQFLVECTFWNTTFSTVIGWIPIWHFVCQGDVVFS